jgi:hypothetical protein
MERKNPFFSTIAEKSIPVTLPLTANNLAIIGYSNRLESKNKPLTTLSVLIEDGVTRLQAKQVILKTTKEGISTTFYPNLGAFWATIKDKQLKDVMAGYSFTSTTFFEDLQASMKSASDYDFIVFPVAVDNGGDTYFILNETEQKDSYGTPYLIGRKARTILEGDISTNVPAGYGITAFLKVYKVLCKVISYFGYTLSDDEMFTSSFKNLCFLNNCADVAVLNNLNYAQLVPDVKVQDLLDVIRTKFCCEFIPDEVTKIIEIRFFKDQVAGPVSVDLTAQRVGLFEYDLQTFKQIVLTQETGLENASVEEPTMEKFMKKYNKIGALNESEWNNIDIVSRYDAVLRLAQGMFYTVEYNGTTARAVAASSVFFNYDKGDDLVKQEILLKDTAAPIVEVKDSLMPFVGSILNLNTAIKDKTEKTKNESNKNIMLCFGKFKTINTLQAAYGNPFNYDYEGQKDGEYSLQTWGEDGIFHRFYKEMDVFYRHSNIIVQAEMLLSEDKKSSVSEIKPILINNQVFLPDTIAFTVGRKMPKACIFRTIKNYEPYDIEKEQSIPTIITNHTSPLYFWQYQDGSSLPPANVSDEYTFRFVGTPFIPTIAPTEEQYLESLSGAQYYKSTIDIIVEHYIQGTLVDDYMGTIEYWYIVGKK